MSILADILTIILLLVSLFMILIVLMQRGSANGGLGAAMGGGMAESALGAESTSVLSKLTRNTAIVFFTLTLATYLLILSISEGEDQPLEDALPSFDVEEAVDATTPGEVSVDAILQEAEAQAESAAGVAEEATPETP